MKPGSRAVLLAALALCLSQLQPSEVQAAGKTVVSVPNAVNVYGGSGRLTNGCFFAGRWVGVNLGTAIIELRGNTLQGVLRQFDDSLAQNLYELTFTATVQPGARSASGQQTYRFLTGLGGPSYSGGLSLSLDSAATRMTLKYSNGFFEFTESMVKVESGACT